MADERCVVHPERDCLGTAAAARLEARIENLERWRDSSHEFHEKFYKWQREQDIKSAKMDVLLESIQSDLSKLVAWQETQQEKPAKRWDAVIEKAILAVVAALVGMFLARIGIG